MWGVWPLICPFLGDMPLVSVGVYSLIKLRLLLMSFSRHMSDNYVSGPVS